jgi:hypothetical protein
MAGQGSGPDVVGVVSLVRPELRELLRQSRIPPESIVELLERALVAAVETWDETSDKGDWVLTMVGSECRAYWQERGLLPPAEREEPAEPERWW